MVLVIFAHRSNSEDAQDIYLYLSYDPNDACFQDRMIFGDLIRYQIRDIDYSSSSLKPKANSNSDCSLIFQIYLKNLLELTSFH